MTMRLRLAALAVMCLGLLMVAGATQTLSASEMCEDIDWDQDFETRYAYAESEECPSQEIGQCTSGEFIEVATFACDSWCEINWSTTIREENYYTLSSPCWYECQCFGVPPVI